ncbi:ABC transporter substrate-binding protein [Paenibacillus beijingensis]|uniref:ABC transporter substrate-binding protein n=1 Tax=Paenibacillus beijingensis TaxID=1126833 RepID=UPI000697E5E7|nr:ABC transporter substrate-binding protein [Paenibacillus beijingensis]
MMMKRFGKKSVLLFLAAVVLVIAGCGNNGNNANGGNTSSPSSSSAEPAATPSAAASPGKLVVTSFGGAYEETQKQFIKEFEQEYNAKVEVVTLYSADALAKIRAEKGNQSIDVVQFSGGQEAVAAKEDLIMKLDSTKLTNLNSLYNSALDSNGYAPAYAFDALGIIYNEEEIKTPPTSWKDLWNPDYKGSVGLIDISNSFGLQFILAAAKMNGGDESNIQPGLDEIKKLIPSAAAIVKSTPEVGNLFAQGEVTIAAYDAGYAFTFRKQGQPIKFVSPVEGAIGTFISAQVVNGSQNADLAAKFVDFLLRADIQKRFAEANGYAPTNKSVELSADLQAVMPYGEEAVNKMVRLNSDLVNTNKATWTEQWNKLISK